MCVAMGTGQPSQAQASQGPALNNVRMAQQALFKGLSHYVPASPFSLHTAEGQARFPGSLGDWEGKP